MQKCEFCAQIQINNVQFIVGNLVLVFLGLRRGVHTQRLPSCLQGRPLHRSIDSACILEKNGEQKPEMGYLYLYLYLSTFFMYLYLYLEPKYLYLVVMYLFPLKIFLTVKVPASSSPVKRTVSRNTAPVTSSAVPNRPI